jgi:hypothetical protein
VTSIRSRACLDCGAADADLPVVLETGTFHGWLCRACERTRRHKRSGWKGRLRRRIRFFG